MQRWIASALALGAVACSRALPGVDVTVRMEFVPAPVVQCIRITAVGPTRTVSRDFAAPVGPAVETFVMRGLPTGRVLVQGRAFDAGCAEVNGQDPTWVTDDVLQTLVAGVSASFTLVFHPNGEAAVTADFKETGVGGTGVPADASCLHVAVVGATRTVERSIELGANVFALSGLPAGDVLFITDGFALPCSDVTATTARTWYGPPVRSTLTAGTRAAVIIELRHVTVSVAVTPYQTSPLTGRTVAFAAMVSGAPVSDVTWSVQEAGGGSIDAGGLYTAPSVAGTFHVVATSVADTSKSDTATVRVFTIPLPPDRVTTWNPGLNAVGGIPNRTTIYRTLTPSGGDDTNAIQTALDSCPPGQVVQLGDGNFAISGEGLSITKSNVVLRGNGPSRTKLFKAAGTSFPVIIMGPRWFGHTQPANLAADALKGQTSVVLASNPGLQVGEIVTIDQLTNTALTWWGANSPPGDPSRGWFSEYDRPLGQTVEIASITGNTITLTTPLHIDFLTAYSAHVVRIEANGGVAPAVKYSGIEDLYVSGGDGGDGGGNIHLFASAYSWVKNIESDLNGGTGVNLEGCFRCVLRDSYVHNSKPPVGPGGGCYGIGLNGYASDNLVENNISWNHNKVMVMRCTGGGNVIAYNYMEDGWGSGYPTIPEVGLNAAHMTTPHFELFEGNQSFNFDGDSVWGNSIYITVFRNHLTGLRRSITPLTLLDANGRRVIGLTEKHWWYSFVGNVLGYSGMPLVGGQTAFIYEAANLSVDNPVPMWKIGYDANYNLDPTVPPRTFRHGNYDFVTNSIHWDASNPNHNLPNSLYLSARPGFFGSSPWPWVDPGTGATSTLPARARFDAMPH